MCLPPKICPVTQLVPAHMPGRVFSRVHFKEPGGRPGCDFIGLNYYRCIGRAIHTLVRQCKDTLFTQTQLRICAKAPASLASSRAHAACQAVPPRVLR